MNAFQKLKTLQSELSEMVLEREIQIEGSLAALLAGVHVLLLGPPGTAKSLLANAICRAISLGKFFQVLLTKFTTPEELLGPFSLRGLKEDRFERITGGYLPEANISFLDEVFKASSAVLNALLGILNERTFRNGTGFQTVPLLTCFGASNELPKAEELGAYNDRFAMRYWVEYLHDPTNRVKMAMGELRDAPSVTLTLDELRDLQAEAMKVEVPQDIRDALCNEIPALLAERGIVVSDRSKRTAVRVLKAIAYLRGNTAVTSDELEVLADMVWAKPEQRIEVLKVVTPYGNPLNLKAIEFLDQATELFQSWEKSADLQTVGMQVSKALKEILAAIDSEVKDRPDSKTVKLRATREKVASFQSAIWKKVMG